jgi:hypothetical protein
MNASPANFNKSPPCATTTRIKAAKYLEGGQRERGGEYWRRISSVECLCEGVGQRLVGG